MATQTSAKFGSVKKPSVVGSVVDAITEAIVAGELRPGERLPSEPELAVSMGVGRSAVREALKVLEALGAIVIQQGSGTYVAEGPSPSILGPLVLALILNAETSRELLELRFAVQLGYFTIAARNATEADWAAIEEAAAALERITVNTDRELDHMIELDEAFHGAILDATHNPLIARIGRTVEQLFFASYRRQMTVDQQPGAAIHDHREIIDALKRSDGRDLKRITERILNDWQANHEVFLKNEGSA